MVEPHRPDPDALLERMKHEANQGSRGRLKIFFGASPGVGKTYAMLQAAHLERKAGVEVLVGVVETHGRAETESLLEGFDILPRKRIDHRGMALDEFDLDAALALRPGLILVDELAHTNAPSCRHRKRWQDVLELVDAGINVYTTVNVQHLDSLNDVIAQITGVVVRETIPDSILDEAGDIELIDLPIDELHRRIQEGKVYLPQQAKLAMESFFRTGNLIALRELALRRTADRVETQMDAYRGRHAIRSSWPVNERLMVSVGPSPFSAKLIRSAKRMADRLDAPWIAAFVETSRYRKAKPEVRQRVLASMRIASELGAETVTLAGEDVAATLLTYASSRNVTKIVLGKQTGPLWKRVWRGSVVDELLGNSGDIGIIAISGEPENLANDWPAGTAPGAIAWRGSIFTLATVLTCTVLSIGLRDALDPVNLVMVFLLGVLAVAIHLNRTQSFLASILSVAAFDYFCVPPYNTFVVSDYEYILTFIVILTVGLLVSTLTGRLRLQANSAVEREARTHLLYRFVQALADERHPRELGDHPWRIVSEAFQVDTAILLPDQDGKVTQQADLGSFTAPETELGIAQWVFDHGQKAGEGTDTLSGAKALYMPLRGARQALGVLAIRPRSSDALTTPEQQHLLEVFCSQAALSMERAQATEEAQTAKLRAETERMRSGLLSAVSHDLRTPLATITGAASSLRAQRQHLDTPAQLGLIECIEQEAERLARLVNNLLEITRIESGSIELKREWIPLEEIVGSSLIRMGSALEPRPVQVDIPVDLPLLFVDEILLEQALINILDNASRYTPANGAIHISASTQNGGILLAIEDSGPGFRPGEEAQIWEKFYRGSAGTGTGAGLGLAICQSIVRAHHGTIEAANRPGGGATFRIWLPVPPQQPEIPDHA